MEDLNHQGSSSSTSESNSQNSNTDASKLGFRLRALSENKSAFETDPWQQAPALQQSIHATSLSKELVNETLNYFVNCGKRLSQMTKTYDDNDAYILLLQEKEVDLELAARIGQDLLKQNEELKNSIKKLEDELAIRRDDVQQLKHELASKISLLDTFIEEEEHQTNLAENEDDTTLRQQDHFPRTITSNSTKPTFLPNVLAQTTSPDIHNYDIQHGFSSLGCNQHHQKQNNISVEPFSSLPFYLNATIDTHGNSHQATKYDDSSSVNSEELNTCLKTSEQKGLVQTVTFQLVESNKKLCELQDELFYKSEQNLIQQEKIFNLQEQIKESERRVDAIVCENRNLHLSIKETVDVQKELSDELKLCKQNFNDLLRVFLELQKESREDRNRILQENSNLEYFGVIDPVNDMTSISFDSFYGCSFDCRAHRDSNQNRETSPKPSVRFSNKRMPISSSLLEELQESKIKNKKHIAHQSSCSSEEHSDADATDEGDSGVHTDNNISSSISPIVHGITETDNEDTSDSTELRNERTWIGFSSYMLTTLLLLCLSVTFTSPSNLNLAQKFQIKLDR